MERLIKFLCNEFPDDALEIQECIDLLNQSISGTVNSIKKELDREFECRGSLLRVDIDSEASMK